MSSSSKTVTCSCGRLVPILDGFTGSIRCPICGVNLAIVKGRAASRLIDKAGWKDENQDDNADLAGTAEDAPKKPLDPHLLRGFYCAGGAAVLGVVAALLLNALDLNQWYWFMLLGLVVGPLAAFLSEVSKGWPLSQAELLRVVGVRTLAGLGAGLVVGLLMQMQTMQIFGRILFGALFYGVLALGSWARVTMKAEPAREAADSGQDESEAQDRSDESGAAPTGEKRLADMRDIERATVLRATNPVRKLVLLQALEAPAEKLGPQTLLAAIDLLGDEYFASRDAVMKVLVAKAALPVVAWKLLHELRRREPYEGDPPHLVAEARKTDRLGRKNAKVALEFARQFLRNHAEEAAFEDRFNYFNRCKAIAPVLDEEAAKKERMICTQCGQKMTPEKAGEYINLRCLRCNRNKFVRPEDIL